MFTKKDLEEWLDILFNIIVDCNICSRNIERLTRRGNDNEEKIKMHGFFQLHYFQLKFILCIQFDKLFSESDNQKVSFYKLFNRLLHEKYDRELMNVLSENKRLNESHRFGSRQEILDRIKEFRHDIELHNHAIQNVKTLRNTFYAHSDIGIKADIENLNIEDFNELATLASKIYNCISSGFFGRPAMFDQIGEWDIGFVLKRMVEDRKNFMKPYSSSSFSSEID